MMLTADTSISIPNEIVADISCCDFEKNQRIASRAI